MNTEDFYKMPKGLARADGYISKKTGEPVKLSASAKIVYMYMLSKNEFFTQKLSGQHYEAQATIADCCGLELKATGNILRSFIDHGLMEGKKIRPNGEGQWRWFYHKVYSDVILWKGSIDSFEILEEKKTDRVFAKIEQPVNKYVHQEDDEYQMPF